jgi:hypothetical protein
MHFLIIIFPKMQDAIQPIVVLYSTLPISCHEFEGWEDSAQAQQMNYWTFRQNTVAPGMPGRSTNLKT